jgi:membrane protein DedA with SNARE-associated domain
MSLSDVSNQLLTYIVTYGAIVLGVVVLLAAIGVPFPSSVFVIAGGAFIQQGVLELYSTILITLVCVVIGDLLSFGMGRLLRRPIQARFGKSAAWVRAEDYFNTHGGLAIYLTRWLLTAIAIPINLVAGTSDFSVRRFAVYVAAGELTWLLVYGALGYAFGSQWQAVSDFIGNFSGVLVGAAVLSVGLYLLFKWPQRAGNN